MPRIALGKTYLTLRKGPLLSHLMKNLTTHFVRSGLINLVPLHNIPCRIYEIGANEFIRAPGGYVERLRLENVCTDNV